MQSLRLKAFRESVALRWGTHTPIKGWHHQAECKNTDIDLWYEEVKTKSTPAKSICQICPVQMSCGTVAFHEERHHEWVYGVRAGLGPTTRKTLYMWLNNNTPIEVTP